MLTESAHMNGKTRHSRRKDARPGELLDAALDLFVEKGFAATRVEEVARQAGVSKGTLFLYFPSKEELFKAVVRHHLSGHFARWSQEIDRFEGSSGEMLRYALTSWWQHIGSTKASGIPKLMMSEAGNFPELAAFYQQEVIEPGTALLKRILLRGQTSGEFRSLNPDYGVLLIMAPMMFLALWQHSFGCCREHRAPLDPATYLNTQIDMLLHGLNMK